MKLYLIPYQTDPRNKLEVYINEDLNVKRRIVCAANLQQDGTIILGVRHFCPLMREAYDKMGYKGKNKHEQGFVDQYGQFVTREDALEIVLGNNQQGLRSSRKRLLTADILFSEDLY